MFSYLFYLGHPSLLGLQRPEDRATLLPSARSSPIAWRRSRALQWPFLCMLSAGAQKSTLRKEAGNFGSLRLIPMIQPPFHSPCAGLQYEHGTKFFHRAVPELRKVVQNFVFKHDS